jgi:membrane-bound transcription factor site-1 protease
LRFLDVHRDTIMAVIRVLGSVWDVHADATYSRGVLSADRAPPWRGKLFIAMSFEDEGEKEMACSPKGNTSSAALRHSF